MLAKDVDRGVTVMIDFVVIIVLAKDVDRRGVAVMIGFVVIIECWLKMLTGEVWL